MIYDPDRVPAQSCNEPKGCESFDASAAASKTAVKIYEMVSEGVLIRRELSSDERGDFEAMNSGRNMLKRDGSGFSDL